MGRKWSGLLRPAVLGLLVPVLGGGAAGLSGIAGIAGVIEIASVAAVAGVAGAAVGAEIAELSGGGRAVAPAGVEGELLPGITEASVARVPVLLVPGWSDGPEELEPLRRRFVRAGWPDAELMAVGFEDPVGSNVDHAREIAAAVDSLKLRTGSATVDVVAHSMGGLATRWYLKDGGAESIRRVVFMATPHRGTLLGWATLTPGGREMRPGSEFLLALKSFRAVPEGVEGLTIQTETDMHIVPNSSALLEGLPNVELCCPTHQGLLDSDEVFDVIQTFLAR